MHPSRYGDWINPPYTGPKFDWAADAKKQIEDSKKVRKPLLNSNQQILSAKIHF